MVAGMATPTDVDTTVQVHAGPSAATCCAPSVGLDPALDAERIATVASSLASPLRVQILDVVRRSPGEICQCELVALFGIGQSLLSHHIRKLVDAGLVSVERRHRWAWYSVPADARQEVSRWLS